MKVVIDHGITGATRAVARQDAIIIVDTIRASTTYVNAFGKGVNRIVPCSSREDLTNRSEKYPDCVKSGERQCKKIEGLNLTVPTKIEGIDSKILNSVETWKDQSAYEAAKRDLIAQFEKNFQRFSVRQEIVQAGPSL